MYIILIVAFLYDIIFFNNLRGIILKYYIKYSLISLVNLALFFLLNMMFVSYWSVENARRNKAIILYFVVSLAICFFNMIIGNIVTKTTINRKYLSISIISTPILVVVILTIIQVVFKIDLLIECLFSFTMPAYMIFGENLGIEFIIPYLFVILSLCILGISAYKKQYKKDF